MVAENIPNRTLGLSRDNPRLIANTGKDLDANIGVFTWFLGIGGTAHPRLDVIPGPAKRRIADLNVERDAAN
jgi:hypothetical protein